MVDKQENKELPIKLANWNDTDILNHLPQLENFLKLHNIDMIFISETHIIPADRFYIPGYKIVRKDRLEKPAGGVAIGVKRCH